MSDIGTFDIELIKRHPLFHGLTNRKKNFVLAYIESNGDLVGAVDKSYRCKSHKSSDSQGRKLLRTFEIRNLLALYYGYDIAGSPMTRDEALGIISARIRNRQISHKEFKELWDRLTEQTGWKPRRRSFEDRDDEEEEIPNPSIEPEKELSVEALVLELESRQKNGK